MSNIKLFSISQAVNELVPQLVLLEKDLQNLIEKNMESFFGVRFLKSEYAITNGRMDSIGIDENNCPVIFEYKRNSNENVINQGLFYLDWLLDHKAEFHLLVAKILGNHIADSIDWTMPCVYCIANSFTKYDLHAVNQMQRNIKLIQYQKYGEDLILFNHLNAPTCKNHSIVRDKPQQSPKNTREPSTRSLHLRVDSIPDDIKKIFINLCDFIESLGDDITKAELKWYLAYKKARNIFCIEVFDNRILVYLNINPELLTLESGFSRDMRGIKHNGTGDVRLVLKNDQDFQKAMPFLQKTYDFSY